MKQTKSMKEIAADIQAAVERYKAASERTRAAQQKMIQDMKQVTNGIEKINNALRQWTTTGGTNLNKVDTSTVRQEDLQSIDKIEVVATGKEPLPEHIIKAIETHPLVVIVPRYVIMVDGGPCGSQIFTGCQN